MKVQYEIHESELADIKRLIAEATETDGHIPAIRDETWPAWIGAAKAHLRALVESAEMQR